MLQALRYINHYVSSNSRHGTHSPFIYKWVDECLYGREGKTPSVESHYNSLKQSHEMISGYDHGKSAPSEMPLSHYARLSAIPKFQGELLARLVSYLKPTNILELGTNIGKGSAYLASGHPDSKVISVEGNEALATVAQKQLEELRIGNVEVKELTFKDFFKSNEERFDLIFIDGDHNLEPTMSYFEACMKCLNPNGLIVFHDINWSSGMIEAWERIRSDQRVNVTVDLFFMGLVWKDLPQAKENFKIRFPRNPLDLVR